MAGTVQVLAGHRLLSAPAGHRTSHDVGVADLLAACVAFYAGRYLDRDFLPWRLLAERTSVDGGGEEAP
jgi:hypothetical protein